MQEIVRRNKSEDGSMKFSEDILNQLNLQPMKQKEPVNVMQVHELLEFLKMSAERIHSKSELYCKETDPDIQLDCMDIVSAKLNDFSQVFKDLILYMRLKEGTLHTNGSLRYSITSYDTFGFEQTEKEKIFLRELILRNEITHDYFNREIHQQKLIWIMENCSEGALDVYHNIKDYCTKKDLLNDFVDKSVL